MSIDDEIVFGVVREVAPPIDGKHLWFYNARKEKDQSECSQNQASLKSKSYEDQYIVFLLS
jgi:hypothetical protein